MLDMRRVAGQTVHLIQTISWGWRVLTPRLGSLFATATRSATMSQGTIKRLTDKGFGFIENGSGTDLFFHMSAVEGVRFEELREGQKVSYNEGRGPKGPRAENIRVL
jgi:CspA family cold shock protein